MSIVQDNKFGPPIRISRIENGHPFGGQPALPGPDIAVIVAQWGPSFKDATHDFFVRGVRISRTTITEESNGRLYRWCVFPDGRVMLVNEGNIRSKRRISKGYMQ